LPRKLSLPAAPKSMSLPPNPLSVSLPLVPVRLSFPLVPLIVAIAISDRSDNCDIGWHNTRGGRDSGNQSRSVTTLLMMMMRG
jgi:hypothetical protein